MGIPFVVNCTEEFLNIKPDKEKIEESKNTAKLFKRLFDEDSMENKLDVTADLSNLKEGEMFIMNDYIAEIDLPCIEFGNLFLVKANNKKEAKNKVYEYCKDSFDYKKSNIIIYSLSEIYKNKGISDTENEVGEIN